MAIHCFTKNVQSIRSVDRFDDLVSDAASLEFDIGFLTETWRQEAEESFELESGALLYLSGGAADGHKGVGIIIHKRLAQQISNCVFRAIGPRTCLLDFTFRTKKFRCLSAYFPTSWDIPGEVLEVYSVLSSLVDGARDEGRRCVIGGDFNANIGALTAADDFVLGRFGRGHRNDRGDLLVSWALSHGFCISSRMSNEDSDHSWTCLRPDGARVQIDFILAHQEFEPAAAWCDTTVGVGVDHRTVHSVLKFFAASQPKRGRRRRTLVGWKPFLDTNGAPSAFQKHIREKLGRQPVTSTVEVEQLLVESGALFGRGRPCAEIFRPSDLLANTMARRREESDIAQRKILSLTIRRQLYRERRRWRAERMEVYIGQASSWKLLRDLQRDLPVRRRLVEQPPADEFAAELSRLFSDLPLALGRQRGRPEEDFSMSEMKRALARLRSNKAADEAGVVGELLQHSPEELQVEILRRFNEVQRNHETPSEWRRTVFIMLAKKFPARCVDDFRPIACARTLYKLYAYLVLQRVEEALEAAQPEEQIGFREGRRLEEHLLTTTLMFEKCFLHEVPLWIVSLDLTKAFDRVRWASLWAALREQGVPDHAIALIQDLYADQVGVVRSGGSESASFQILSGVRQGCILSPRLFAAVLQFAMRRWRARLRHGGFNLGDGGANLVDLRLADDLLLFSASKGGVFYVLDALVAELAAVGLILNPGKTKILTNEAQVPAFVTSPGGLRIQVVSHDEAHKWLGCMINGSQHRRHAKDVEYHLQAASKAFYSNRAALCNRNVSILVRLRFFASVVTSVACFASGHRTPRREDIEKMDVTFRSFARQIVGPPPNTDFTQPWHVVLHLWNARVSLYTERARIHSWGQESLRNYFDLAGWVARLPSSRWVRRVMAWNPPFSRRPGRPPLMYPGLLTAFCHSRGLGDWERVAACKMRWQHLQAAFLLSASQ